jgi:hypothetical protein
MSKPTINRYVALNMIGTFPIARRYEGAMPHAAFELLVIAAESFIMIKGVNKDHIERNTLMIMFNELCGVTSSKGRVKENLFFERVMRAMNVSLNASVSPTVEDRRVRWTTYSNLHAWFVSFKAFLIEFGFATIGGNSMLVISEAMLRRIANVDEMEVSLDGSKTNDVLENAVTRLTGKELEVLLRWKGVPVSKMGNVANRRVLYQQFADGGEEEEDDASIPAPWTDADKAGLVALRNAPIEMADTSYGRFLTTQKRDAERAYQHMEAEEREAFLRKLTEIDADDAEDGQPPPSNPTPV